LDDVPPPGITLPPGMKRHTLPAGDETLVFWGQFIDSVDTDDGDRTRWAELQWWDIIDTNPGHDDKCPDEENRGMFGKRMYLLYTIGHSLVYHDLDGPCKGGVATRAADFGTRAEDPDDTVPCEKCSPEDWQQVPGEQKFRLEVTWHSYTACQTAEKMIESLSRCRNCRDKPHAGVRCYKCGCTGYDGVLTSPGYKLVQQVKDRYPEVARAVARTKRF
jgi:hypothetical protein